MKYSKLIVMLISSLVLAYMLSAYTNNNITNKPVVLKTENPKMQTINLFVTHGHCSTPFGGIVEKLEVHIPKQTDFGNPMENMSLSFEIDPNSFKVCASEDLTAKMKSSGLFVNETNNNIKFTSTNIYTMGLDWYQLNGTLSIKGVEKDVKLFVTGIREKQDTMASTLVLEGQMNLLDWGIDYDLIVNGTPNPNPTKWMHMNMKVDLF